MYKILHATSHSALAILVGEAQAEGWEPHGSMNSLCWPSPWSENQFMGFEYSQPMIKTDATDKILAYELTKHDDTRDCRFCNKQKWGKEFHEENCPFAIAYKILDQIEKEA